MQLGAAVRPADARWTASLRLNRAICHVSRATFLRKGPVVGEKEVGATPMRGTVTLGIWPAFDDLHRSPSLVRCGRHWFLWSRRLKIARGLLVSAAPSRAVDEVHAVAVPSLSLEDSFFRRSIQRSDLDQVGPSFQAYGGNSRNSLGENKRTSVVVSPVGWAACSTFTWISSGSVKSCCGAEETKEWFIASSLLEVAWHYQLFA